MSHGWIDAIFITLLGLIVLGGISFLFYAVHEDSVRQDKCMMAGGIPIEHFCVKPDSFIEVK